MFVIVSKPGATLCASLMYAHDCWGKIYTGKFWGSLKSCLSGACAFRTILLQLLIVQQCIFHHDGRSGHSLLSPPCCAWQSLSRAGCLCLQAWLLSYICIVKAGRPGAHSIAAGMLQACQITLGLLPSWCCKHVWSCKDHQVWVASVTSMDGCMV